MNEILNKGIITTSIGEFRFLESNNAQFGKLISDAIAAVNAKITNLEVEKITTKDLEVENISINGTAFDPTNLKSFVLSDARSNPKPYDIIENGIFPTENENEFVMRSNYIPDATFFWRDNHKYFVDNHIVKIIDGVCYNENDEQVCYMETNKIVKCGLSRQV